MSESRSQYKDKEWLYEHFYRQDLSMREIGELANVDSKTIHYWLEKHGIWTAKPTIHRFWRYVDTEGEGCYEWTGGTKPSGYGNFGNEDHVMVGAHRYRMQLIHGEIDGMVLHHCDNPPCVRREHLYIGDGSDNIRDAVVRGHHNKTRLTKNQVKEIRRRYENEDTTYKELGEEYGVGLAHIGQIVNRRCWADI